MDDKGVDEVEGREDDEAVDDILEGAEGAKDL